MSLENVANEDLEIDFSNNTGPSDISYTGVIGITDPAISTTISTKCEAVGKGICTDKIVAVFIVAGEDCPHTSALYDFVSGGGTITATATKVKAENEFVLRQGDANSVPGCIGSWKLKASPFTVEPCQCDFEISTAGQTKVKAQ
jgi:hypothetical protein